MAAKTIERVYNVPLRKEYQKVPRWRRTKKAVKALREYLARHMKTQDVKLSQELNNEMWKHGIKNPPHHIKVTVTKDESGIASAQLFGVKKKEVKVKKAPKKESVLEAAKKKLAKK